MSAANAVDTSAWLGLLFFVYGPWCWSLSRSPDCEFFFVFRIRLLQAINRFEQLRILLVIRYVNLEHFCHVLYLRLRFLFLQASYRIRVIFPEVFCSYCTEKECRNPDCENVDGCPKLAPFDVDEACEVQNREKEEQRKRDPIGHAEDVFPYAHSPVSLPNTKIAHSEQND